MPGGVGAQPRRPHNFTRVGKPSTYATAVTANASGAPVTPSARTPATPAVDSPFLRPYRRGF